MAGKRSNSPKVFSSLSWNWSSKPLQFTQGAFGMCGPSEPCRPGAHCITLSKLYAAEQRLYKELKVRIIFDTLLETFVHELWFLKIDFPLRQSFIVTSSDFINLMRKLACIPHLFFHQTNYKSYNFVDALILQFSSFAWIGKSESTNIWYSKKFWFSFSFRALVHFLILLPYLFNKIILFNFQPRVGSVL